MNLILFTPDELGRTLSRMDKRAVHLLKVLKKKPGDSFDAGVLEGDVGTGIIEALRPGGIVFSLSLTKSPPPRTPLRLGVGFPRPIQLKRLLRDCSSLGLEAVDLLGTELGEKSYRDTKLLHDGGARSALLEGAAQARDTRLPSLGLYRDLAAWLKDRPWDAPGGDSKAGPLLAAADNVRPEGAFSSLASLWGGAVLAVGAERGWTDRERDMLEEAGFVRLALGKRALRTETACVAAAALLMEKMDLLG
ncbi:MAG: 16S rRNA (uracil(1498)-N(3))-methyltransferase [Treponema sp.]|jgi:RsmE family RNA methyltransferase|nr:16S rRNA (uracil(1498)-N(3))-methyltransferase [Treponema sp.]